MTLREALIAMGYREARPGKWTKPVGYHLFTFSEERNEWVNWYLPGNSEDPAPYDTDEANHDLKEAGDYVRQIKEWEAWTRINVQVSQRAHFEGRGLDL